MLIINTLDYHTTNNFKHKYSYSRFLVDLQQKLPVIILRQILQNSHLIYTIKIITLLYNANGQFFVYKKETLYHYFDVFHVQIISSLYVCWINVTARTIAVSFTFCPVNNCNKNTRWIAYYAVIVGYPCVWYTLYMNLLSVIRGRVKKLPVYLTSIRDRPLLCNCPSAWCIWSNCSSAGTEELGDPLH